MLHFIDNSNNIQMNVHKSTRAIVSDYARSEEENGKLCIIVSSNSKRQLKDTDAFFIKCGEQRPCKAYATINQHKMQNEWCFSQWLDLYVLRAGF